MFSKFGLEFSKICKFETRKITSPHFLKQQLPTVNDMGSQQDGTPAKLNFAKLLKLEAGFEMHSNTD
jgi:hypothetical protein